MSDRKLRLNQIHRHGAPEEVVTVTEWDVTPGLHEWITGEIQLREQTLRAADKEIGRTWRTRWDASTDSFEVVTESGLLVASGLSPGVAGHIAGNDPATVLRRCAADRKTLAVHPYTTQVINPSYGPHSAGFGCETCHDWDGVPEGRGNCPTILALAEAYELDEADSARRRPRDPPGRRHRPRLHPRLPLRARSSGRPRRCRPRPRQPRRTRTTGSTVSSTYRVLCLSHDPAIVIERDWHRPEGAEEAVAAGIDGHPHCDLAIGRFSYPLVEVGCPPTRHQPAILPCHHGGTYWVDSNWLRLLAAGYQTTDLLVEAAVKKARADCWPWERLLRLRDELDLQLRETP